MTTRRRHDGSWSISDDEGRIVLDSIDARVELDGAVVRLSGASDALVELGASGARVTIAARDLTVVWTVDERPSGYEVAMTVENRGGEAVGVERLVLLDADVPSVEAGASLRFLDTGGGSWGAKSLGELGGSGEAALVSAVSTPEQNGVVCGFVTVARYRGFVRWSRDGGHGRLAVSARHELAGDRSARSALGGAPDTRRERGRAGADAAKEHPGILDPGRTIASETLLLAVGDVFAGLESWAETTGRNSGAVTMSPPAAGFYSWYYYREHVDEEVILSNARYLAEHRDRLPVNYVHLDWGWQREYSCGDREVGPGFPNGLAWLAARVRELGFIPGLWLTAFMHDHPTSALPVERPELFQRGEDGRPIGFGEPIRNIMDDMIPDMHTRRPGTQYRIDPTAPGVADYLRERYAWALEQGYGEVMLDFTLHGVPSPEATKADPRMPWIEAMRRAMGAIREAIGEETMIMGCGAAYEPMIGYGNFVRVAVDIPAHWKAVKAGCRPLLWHYFMHDRLWTNYADAVSVRAKPAPTWPAEGDGSPLALTLDEARFYVTVTGLSAAAVMIAEDLAALPAEREALLSLILPICDEGEFRPLDLFATDSPRLLRRRFDRGGDEWSVVAALNWDDEPDAEGATVGSFVEFAGTGQADGGGSVRVHAYDVFADRYLGILGADERLAPVAPHGTVLARLTPCLGRPQLVGTTMHISQGAVETRSVVWDEEAGELVVDLADLSGRRGEIIVAAPEPWRLRADRIAGAAGNVASGLDDATRDGEASGAGATVLRVPVLLDGRTAVRLPFSKVVR